MPSQGFRLGLPPPAPLFDASIEDIVDVTKIVVTKAGTVTSLGGWISGNPAGANPNQPGRFHLYADNGSGLNPGAFLVRTVEGTVTGATPTNICVRLPVETPGVQVTPGVYWVGVFVGNAQGTGEWQVHGEANAGGIGKKNTAVYPTQPNPFPLTGVATFTGTSAALGFVYTQLPTEVTGAICGTFKCGTLKAGQFDIQFNQPSLVMKGGEFEILIANDIKIVRFPNAPKLTLKAKTAAVSLSLGVTMEAPQLLIQAKSYSILIPAIVHALAPKLALRGGAASVQASTYLSFEQAQLLLLARIARGYEPGLVPTDPVDFILVPTFPIQTYSPPATTEESLILVPTVERVL